MLGTRTVFFDGLNVLLRAVALVFDKVVFGVFIVKTRHISVALHLCNDGCRCNHVADRVTMNKGNGLKGMRERLEFVNGSLDIQINSGTELIFRVPLIGQHLQQGVMA